MSPYSFSHKFVYFVKIKFFMNENRKLGWRLGLQAIAAMSTLSFFMGLLYRSASLYHPQRRAIQHLKNQRRKVSVVFRDFHVVSL